MFVRQGGAYFVTERNAGAFLSSLPRVLASLNHASIFCVIAHNIFFPNFV